MATATANSDVYNRLVKVIPGGVNSPVRACKGLLEIPLVAESGKGDTIVDSEGNSFIDYCGSWGALIHGHAHPLIHKAVENRMAKGSSFGITTEIEEKLAKKIVDNLPSVEMVRFVSSGTEAAMSAVRLARGYTGRDIAVKFDGNYHGHADLFLVNAGSGLFSLTPTSSSEGVPADSVKNTVSLPYNDVERCKTFLQNNGDAIAAVILEPIAGNMGVVPAKREFIEMLRRETEARGICLIFDEVISGFRVGLQGAQGLFGITPDLTCLGKVIGGGFPAAAFGGKKEIMRCLAPLGKVYQAGTLSGNPVAMEAGYQALLMAEERGFYELLKEKSALITQPVAEAIEKKKINAALQSAGSMFTLFFGRKSVSNSEEAKELDSEQFNRFFRHLYSRGIYAPPSQHEAWFVSMAHTEKNLLYTRDAIIEFLEQC